MPPWCESVAALCRFGLLFDKQPVISTTCGILRPRPHIASLSTVAAGLLMPVFISHTPLNFAGNIIALVYLLALGNLFPRFWRIGRRIGVWRNVGSSREAIVVTLAEPAMILSILAIALTAGSTNLSAIVQSVGVAGRNGLAPPAHLMALAAMFIVTLAEPGVCGGQSRNASGTDDDP